MARELRLVRRVTATAGGWAGDGSVWSGTTPVVASVQAGEVGSPIFPIPLRRVDANTELCRGAAGLVRVTGADAARRFTLNISVEWVRAEDGQAKVSEWRPLMGATGLNIGNGEDFTTDPAWMQDQRIAFHLVPIGGNLASASVVEIWAAEI